MTSHDRLAMIRRAHLAAIEARIPADQRRLVRSPKGGIRFRYLRFRYCGWCGEWMERGGKGWTIHREYCNECLEIVRQVERERKRKPNGKS